MLEIVCQTNKLPVNLQYKNKYQKGYFYRIYRIPLNMKFISNLIVSYFNSKKSLCTEECYFC